MKIQSTKYNNIYFWIVKVIKSANSQKQIPTLKNLVKNFEKNYTSGNSKWDKQLVSKLNKRIDFFSSEFFNRYH